MFKPSSLIFLALIFAGAYFIDLPKRIDWAEIETWDNFATVAKIRDRVSGYSKTRMQEIGQDARGESSPAPVEKSKPDKEAIKRQKRMTAVTAANCQPNSISLKALLSLGQYQAHLESRNLGVDSPIRRVTPYCKTNQGGDVFVPDWLDDRILIIDAASRDSIIMLK